MPARPKTPGGGLGFSAGSGAGAEAAAGAAEGSALSGRGAMVMFRLTGCGLRVVGW